MPEKMERENTLLYFIISNTFSAVHQSHNYRLFPSFNLLSTPVGDTQRFGKRLENAFVFSLTI